LGKGKKPKVKVNHCELPTFLFSIFSLSQGKNTARSKPYNILACKKGDQNLRLKMAPEQRSL